MVSDRGPDLLMSRVYPAQEGELRGGQGADQVQPHVQARPVRVGLLPVNNITTCNDGHHNINMTGNGDGVSDSDYDTIGDVDGGDDGVVMLG